MCLIADAENQPESNKSITDKSSLNDLYDSHARIYDKIDSTQLFYSFQQLNTRKVKFDAKFDQVFKTQSAVNVKQFNQQS